MKTRSIIILCLLAVIFVLTGYTMIKTASWGNPSSEIPPEEFIKEWKKVDSLVEQGLPQSALEIVRDVYSTAKTTHNSPQFVKSLLYQMSLQSDFQEDFMDTIIADTRQEILLAEFPVRQILSSIQAELYWRYYTMNRHLILGRTTTVDFLKEDISDLLNEKQLPDKQSINDQFAEYDKELMSFKRNVSRKNEWPTPIRKRVCIK